MRGILIESDPADPAKCFVSIPESTALRSRFDAMPDDVKDDFVVAVLAVIGRRERLHPRLKPGCLELRAPWLKASTDRNLALGEGDYLAKQALLRQLGEQDFDDASDLLEACLRARQ